jgi:hypothetical protein
MKLYTEEQMAIAINWAKGNPLQARLILEQLTPIELPSVIDPINGDKDEFDLGFINGAKWMRDKLTNTK